MIKVVGRGPFRLPGEKRRERKAVERAERDMRLASGLPCTCNPAHGPAELECPYHGECAYYGHPCHCGAYEMRKNESV